MMLQPYTARVTRQVTALAVLLVMFSAVPLAAAGRQYKAQRYDSDIVVRPGGDLQVHETVVFEFQSGTFVRVWREIPARRTDGIEVLGASMDGRPVPFGSEPGEATVSGTNRVRVEWHLPPTGPSVHTFEVSYIARGVAYASEGTDLVEWQALPREHAYPIDASRIAIDAPAPPLRAPAIDRHRVGAADASVAGTTTAIVATAIQSNGTVTASLRYPSGSVVATAPHWIQEQNRQRDLAPTWFAAAVVVLVVALLLVVAVKSRYRAPEPWDDSRSTQPQPPEALPPALAAALANRGRAGAGQAMATLVDLADRGVVSIRELPRTWGIRHYELTRITEPAGLSRHEAVALAAVFREPGEAVDVTRARSRLARAWRQFSAAVEADLDAMGLLDRERQAARRVATGSGIALLVAGALSSIAAAALIPRFGAYPFAIVVALDIAGMIGTISGATMTSLSDSGVARAREWTAFKRHLRRIARGESTGAAVTTRWTTYAVALGLGYVWASFLKRHPSAVPAWFRVAGDQGDAAAAWVTFIGSSGVSSGAGGAGGAAGGGSSGAG